MLLASRITGPVVLTLLVLAAALRPSPALAAEDVVFTHCVTPIDEAIAKSIIGSDGGQLVTTGAANCLQMGLVGSVAETGWVYSLYGYEFPYTPYTSYKSYKKYSENVIEVAGSHNTCTITFSSCNTSGWESTLVY